MAIFRFGEFEADEERFDLRWRGHSVRVQRVVLATIFYFLRSGGRLVTKRDLALGPRQGAQVGDAAVARAIMLARRAIRDPTGRVIVTVHGVGYRFEGAVRVTAQDGDQPAPSDLFSRSRAMNDDLA